MSDLSKSTIVTTKEELENTSSDYAALRHIGLDTVQTLSGDEWTDYNEHDPGVTILEQVCYALTDVAYRASFPISELLTPGEGQPIEYKKNAFFPPAAILSTHPVTISDIRKLVIDQFDEIRNAWVIPQEHLEFGEQLRGTYRVEILPTLTFHKKITSVGEKHIKNGKKSVKEGENLIEENKIKKGEKFVKEGEELIKKGESLIKKRGEELLSKKVKTFLNKNRNLGEDFSEVCFLMGHEIEINLKVHLKEKVNLENAIADLFYSLFELFYRPVTHYSFAQLSNEGLNVNEIFSGPKLRQEFTKTEELKERLVVVSAEDLQKYCSDKVHEILHCKVTNLKTYENESRTILKVKPKHFFHIKIDDSFDTLFENLELFVRGKKVVGYNKPLVERLFLDKWAKKYRNYSANGWVDDFVIQKLKAPYKNPTDYHSIQNHFPLIYGIGKDGLSTNEPAERRAKALQLKSYLLFFEQHIANQLAQIGNLPEFFNIEYEHSSKSTYFTQKISIPGYTNKNESDHPLWRTTSEESLSGLLETKKEFLFRKNKIYDHLLARFGEDLDNLPWQIVPQLHRNQSFVTFYNTLLNISKELKIFVDKNDFGPEADLKRELETLNREFIEQLRKPLSEDELLLKQLHKKSELLRCIDNLSYFKTKGESFSINQEDILFKKRFDLADQIGQQHSKMNDGQVVLQRTIQIAEKIEQCINEIPINRKSKKLKGFVNQINALRYQYEESQKLVQKLASITFKFRSFDIKDETNTAPQLNAQLEKIKNLAGPTDEKLPQFIKNFSEILLEPLKQNPLGIRHPSGLEQMLSIKTGIPQRGHRKLYEVSREGMRRYPNIFSDVPDLQSQSKNHRALKLIERHESPFNNAGENNSEPDFRNMDVKMLFKETLDFTNYKITDSKDSKVGKSIDSNQARPEDSVQVEVLFKKGEKEEKEENWIKILEKPNSVEAIRNIHYIIDSIAKLNNQSEGFYLVDHILLKDFLNKTEKSFGFCFLDEYGKPLFKTPEKESWGSSKDERNERLQEFYKLGLTRNNYVFNQGNWEIRNCNAQYEFKQVIDQKLNEFLWEVKKNKNGRKFYYSLQSYSKTLSQIKALLIEYNFEKVFALHKTEFRESLKEIRVKNIAGTKIPQFIKSYFEKIDKLVDETNHARIIKNNTKVFLSNIEKLKTTGRFGEILQETLSEFLEELEENSETEEIRHLFRSKMVEFLHKAKKRNISNNFIEELEKYLNESSEEEEEGYPNREISFKTLLEEMQIFLEPKTVGSFIDEFEEKKEKEFIAQMKTSGFNEGLIKEISQTFLENIRKLEKEDTYRYTLNKDISRLIELIARLAENPIKKISAKLLDHIKNLEKEDNKRNEPEEDISKLREFNSKLKEDQVIKDSDKLLIAIENLVKKDIHRNSLVKKVSEFEKNKTSRNKDLRKGISAKYSDVFKKLEDEDKKRNDLKTDISTLIKDNPKLDEARISDKTVGDIEKLKSENNYPNELKKDVSKLKELISKLNDRSEALKILDDIEKLVNEDKHLNELNRDIFRFKNLILNLIKMRYLNFLINI